MMAITMVMVMEMAMVMVRTMWTLLICRDEHKDFVLRDNSRSFGFDK